MLGFSNSQKNLGNQKKISPGPKTSETGISVVQNRVFHREFFSILLETGTPIWLVCGNRQVLRFLASFRQTEHKLTKSAQFLESDHSLPNLAYADVLMAPNDRMGHLLRYFIPTSLIHFLSLLCFGSDPPVLSHASVASAMAAEWDLVSGRCPRGPSRWAQQSPAQR